jgi:methanogenic corrinoid protein MtbC1
MRGLLDELHDEYDRMSAKLAAAETVAAAKEQPTTPQLQRRSKLPKDCKINIVCLPAHDEADEIAAIMVAQLLSLRGYCAEAVASGALVSEKLEAIAKNEANLVCVSALPPAAISHARYLCKRIHARFAGTKMIVGLWSGRADPKRAKERITCGEDVVLASSLAGVQDKIDQLAQPLMINGSR